MGYVRNLKIKNPLLIFEQRWAANFKRGMSVSLKLKTIHCEQILRDANYREQIKNEVTQSNM